MNRLIPEALLFGLLLLPCADWAQPTPPDPKRAAEFVADSAAGLKTLQTWYVEETGLWKTTGWWNAANAVTVLVNYSKLSDTPDFRPTIANTFERNSRKHFINEYYDDEGWWALGWAGAYELSHDARYLEMAELIFADMATGWDDTCGGGIWWKKPKQYKNAIANELFLSVAARLGNLTQDPHKRATYLEWAQREWKWFAASGMINPENLVNDGLDSECHNNHRTTWTYNQGVILGGLTALAKLSGDAKLLEVAQSIASAAISRLTDQDGMLHDPCEPGRCGNDAVQFKGIFARNLAVLNSATPMLRFRAFLRTNAEGIWKNRDPDNRFGVVWSGPSDVKNAATQVSALDALLAAAESEGAAALFPAIKMSVDEDRRPGRFILTGSANIMMLPKLSESLAGRMEILTLRPFSQGELEDRHETFIKRLFSGRGFPITDRAVPALPWPSAFIEADILRPSGDPLRTAGPGSHRT